MDGSRLDSLGCIEKRAVLEMNFASAMSVWRTFMVADTWVKPHGPALSADITWAVRRQDFDKCGLCRPASFATLLWHWNFGTQPTNHLDLEF